MGCAPRKKHLDASGLVTHRKKGVEQRLWTAGGARTIFLERFNLAMLIKSSGSAEPRAATHPTVII